MNNQTSFRRIAAISAILSAALALASFAIVILVVDFNFELLSNQAALIKLGARAAGIFRWGEILGLFGYYFLFIPIAIYLQQWLKSHNPDQVNLYTVCSLGYIFIGASGAIIRANIFPEMMYTYAQASSAQREMLLIIFKVLSDVIFNGLGVLELFLIGVWWLGIGLVMRSERSILGIATAILGAASLVAGVGIVVHIEPMAGLEGITFLISPFWAFWLGTVIWRNTEKAKLSGEPVREGRAAQF